MMKRQLWQYKLFPPGDVKEKRVQEVNRRSEETPLDNLW
jgi:hypothetical protein